MRAMNLLACIALVAALLLGSCAKENADQQVAQQGGQPVLGEPVDEDAVAVTVNGMAVTNRELAEEEGRLMQQLGGRVDAQQMGEMKSMVKQQAMNNIISRMLLDGAVAEEGITVTPEEIDARLAEVKASIGSDEAFSQRLAVMGITEDLFVREMGTALKVEKLLARRGEVVEVTEADVRSYYDENPQMFNRPERVKASHILIKVDENDTAAEKEEKQKEVVRVLAELRQGADFAEMASQHSWCPSKKDGGDLGFFQRGQMVKPFEDAAFSLGIGELSDVVETQYGYHIIKVTDREDARTVGFEEAKPGIQAYLEGQRKQQAMGALVEELRGKATIEYPE
jgi:peptidyl-prolyl cis-trans isomerase C